MKIAVAFVALFCTVIAVATEEGASASPVSGATTSVGQTDPTSSSTPALSKSTKKTASTPAQSKMTSSEAAPTTTQPKTTSTKVVPTTTQPKTTSTKVVPTTTQPKTTSGNTKPPTTSGPTTAVSVTSSQPATGGETTNGYEYSENKTVCLKAKFSAHFEQHKTIWNVSGDAEINNVTSECGVLSVNFSHGSFNIDFGQKKDKKFFIDRVSASLPGVEVVSVQNKTWAITTNGSSYTCEAGFSIDMSHNVTMVLKHVQLQAYYVKDGTFGIALQCTADFPDNLLVPIIVGCALGGLIVVVLIAYCILRARTSRHYDPVRNP